MSCVIFLSAGDDVGPLGGIRSTELRRPAATLGPVSARTWRRWEDIAGMFTRPADHEWAQDRGLIDQSIEDPWSLR